MYEPIPTDETADCSPVCNEIETWENSGEEMQKSAISLVNCDNDGNSVGSRMVPYPANYRYQNSSDNYDDEDELKLAESDLYDDDDFGNTDEEEDEGWKNSEFEFIEHFYSQSKGFIEENITNAQLPAERTNKCMPLNTFSVLDLKKLEQNCSARDRSQYVHSVLNPVANLSQWKAVKARSAPSSMHQKENIPSQEQHRRLNMKTNFNQSLSGSISNLDISKPLMQEVVDSSLANWLASPENKWSNLPSIGSSHNMHIS